MGICCTNPSSKRTKSDPLELTKTTLSKFKKNYYKQLTNSSNLPQTTDTSNKQKNYNQEIYSFNKYGIQSR